MQERDFSIFDHLDDDHYKKMGGYQEHNAAVLKMMEMTKKGAVDVLKAAHWVRGLDDPNDAVSTRLLPLFARWD